MKSKLMFSILIPNYGYSPLIFECLDSVVNQKTDDLFNYEIIMCDQNEIDIFSRLKNEIEKKYGNRVVLIHSDVKGTLRARHTLMKYASGEYMQFVDSDDFIDHDCLINLYSIIDKDDPDIIFIGHKNVDFSGNIIKESPSLLSEEKEHFFDFLLCANKFNSICYKIFKRSLYSAGNYNYLDSTNGDDKNFSLPIVKKSKSITFNGDLRFYNYRSNPSSMTHSFSIKDAESSLFLLRDLDYDIKTFSAYQKKLFYKNFLDSLSGNVGILKSNSSKKEIKALFKDAYLYCKDNSLLSIKCKGIKFKVKSFLFKSNLSSIFIFLAGK